MRKFLRLAVMAALLGAAARAFVPFGWAPHAFAPHALAQHDLAQHDLAATYPNRAVKIVVSAPAGGGLDIAARVVAEQLAKMWGQPFVVENRPGAGGGLGA
jgi:tripartite-type tricarboxylate transporter receptor subunit TctC